MARRNHGRLRRIGALCLGVAALAAVGAGCGSSSDSSSGGGGASTSGGGGGAAPKIAFSNSTLGNTWHQQLIRSIETAARDAQDQGLISGFTSANANGNPSEQANQIRSFVVGGYDAILVDASSATALNGAIKQACARGVMVLAVDQTVTEKCSYSLVEDFRPIGQTQAEFMSEALGGRGSVLEIRGTAGTLPDDIMHRAVVDTLKQKGDLRIVGSVYADWTDTTAQQKVSTLLPSLSRVDAVIGQGGDGHGAVVAFQNAGKQVPIVGFGNRAEELQTWADLSRKDPSYRSVSISTMPGIGSAGIWAIVAKLHGTDVPQTIDFPLLKIPQENLAAWVKVTPKGGVASTDVTYDETKALIEKTKAGTVPTVVTATPGNVTF